MRVGLISATKASLDPIENAFRENAPEIELVHFLDSSLLLMLREEGYISPEIIRRFVKMLDSAVDSKVDVILFTCSAFNDITSILQPLYDVKIFRSDEAVLDLALSYEKIGLLSTVTETPVVLTNYLKGKSSDVVVVPKVEDGLIHMLNKGMKKEHDDRVKEMIYEMEKIVDVIVLTQFSMEHVADQVDCSIPILTAPRAAASRSYEYIKKGKVKQS